MSDLAISSITFRNFRCLRNVRIDFGSFTALVGANGSGKSTIFRALQKVHEPIEDEDVWGLSKSLEVSIDFALRNHGHISISRENGRHDESSSGVRDVPRWEVLRLDIARLREPVALVDRKIVEPSGSGLVNLFRPLGRERQQELVARFCSLIPLYRDVDISIPRPGHAVLRFEDRWNRGVWYLPHQVSDGTVLVFAYLLLQYQESQVDVIAVEEPERGLHPYLLGQLVRFLRGLSKGEFGNHPVQIILATHSAELLNHMEPEEVRFLSRDSNDGSTVVDRVTAQTPDWQRAFREYDSALGFMWLSGGLGGVPGR